MMIFIIFIILIILIIALICADSCLTGHPGTNLGQQALYACKDSWRSWRKILPYSSSCMVCLYQENISSWPASPASRQCILQCILRPGWRLITLLSSCCGNTQYQAVQPYESIFSFSIEWKQTKFGLSWNGSYHLIKMIKIIKIIKIITIIKLISNNQNNQNGFK